MGRVHKTPRTLAMPPQVSREPAPAVPGAYASIQNESSVPVIRSGNVSVPLAGANMVPTQPLASDPGLSYSQAPAQTMSAPTPQEVASNRISTFVPGTHAAVVGADNSMTIVDGRGQTVGTIAPGSPGYRAYEADAQRYAARPSNSRHAPTEAPANAPAAQPGQPPTQVNPDPYTAPVTAARSGAPTQTPAQRLAARYASEQQGTQGSGGKSGEDAFQVLADQGSRVSEQAAQGMERRAGMLQDQNDQAQAAEADRQDQMQRAQESVNQRISEVENMRIDPNQWFSSRGVVGSIGAAIAVGLGAAAQSIQGNGPNNALGIINSAIDRDIAAQTENLRNAGMRLNNRENALASLRQRFGDARVAEDAFRLRSLQMADQQIAAGAARAQNPTSREMYAAMRAELAPQIELIRERTQQTMLTQTHQAVLAAESRRTGGGGGGGARNLQLRNILSQSLHQQHPTWTPEQIAAHLDANAPVRGLQGTDMPQAPGRAPTQAQQDAQVAQVGAESDLNGIRSAIREMEAGGTLQGMSGTQQAGRQIGSSPDSGLMSQAAGSVLNSMTGGSHVDPRITNAARRIGAMRHEMTGASLTDAEIRMNSTQLPDLTGRFRTQADLLGALQNAEQTLASTANAYNSWVARGRPMLQSRNEPNSSGE